MNKTVLIMFLFMGVAARVPAAEVRTMGDVSLLVGQYFFNTSQSSLAGNIAATVVPVVKYSERLTLIPMYRGQYRGTKEAADLFGGDTLFQDAQSHTLSLKAVYALAPVVKAKLEGGYRAEFLRETRDETWGNGLFDYTKTNGGAEMEFAYARGQKIRAGVDAYIISFTNYATLESSAAAGGLGRELAGKNTLDTSNLTAAVTHEAAFSGFSTTVSAALTNRAYPSQTTVLPNGELSSNKRRDSIAAGSMEVARPWRVSRGTRLVVGVNVQGTMVDSNQNHYDARKYVYLPDYYDYTTVAAGMDVSFLFGPKPWGVTVGTTMSRQDYAERLVQNTDGDYGSEAIRTDETAYTATVTYPLRDGFKLRLTGSFIDARSNMKYEKTFAYNYQTSNYLMGFSYEF